MKPSPLQSLLLLAVGSSLLAISTASAADGTWTKNATGTQNWTTATNWLDGNVASGADFTGTIDVTAGRHDAFTNNGRLGNAANGIQVSSGAQMYLHALNTSTRAITINGDGPDAGDSQNTQGPIGYAGYSSSGGTFMRCMKKAMLPPNFLEPG